VSFDNPEHDFSNLNFDTPTDFIDAGPMPEGGFEESFLPAGGFGGESLSALPVANFDPPVLESFGAVQFAELGDVPSFVDDSSAPEEFAVPPDFVPMSFVAEDDPSYGDISSAPAQSSSSSSSFAGYPSDYMHADEVPAASIHSTYDVSAMEAQRSLGYTFQADGPITPRPSETPTIHAGTFSVGPSAPLSSRHDSPEEKMPALEEESEHTPGHVTPDRDAEHGPGPLSPRDGDIESAYTPPVNAAAISYVLLPVEDSLPDLPSYSTHTHSVVPQHPGQQKDQEKMKRQHEKELAAKDAAANTLKNKRAATHKSTTAAMEKAHDKAVQLQKRDEADRPSKLQAQHGAEQKQLIKEMEADFKNRTANQKKAMKTWKSEQENELKAKLNEIKNTYKKDKSALKTKTAQAEGEAKIRMQQYPEKDALQVEHACLTDRLRREREMANKQVASLHELLTDLQRTRHSLERRLQQEQHREQQKQLSEVHQDELDALSLRQPIESRHFQEICDLDVDFLNRQIETQLTELSHQIVNKHKTDRKEYEKKKKQQAKMHEETIKSIKKANKDKNAPGVEKARFQKEQEEQDAEFEKSLRDEAAQKEADLKAALETQRQALLLANSEADESLKSFQSLFRKHMVRRHTTEMNSLLETQRKQVHEMLDQQHKESLTLLKRHHDQILSMTREQGEHQKVLLEKQLGDRRDLISRHLSVLSSNPHCEALHDQVSLPLSLSLSLSLSLFLSLSLSFLGISLFSFSISPTRLCCGSSLTLFLLGEAGLLAV
jgi:hypothetical protein